MWPTRAKVQQHMPESFKKKYPTTIVILDATEVKVVKPSDPAEQQMRFSSYKKNSKDRRNCSRLELGSLFLSVFTRNILSIARTILTGNTFKSLIGITPSGAICFVSSLYSGSISDIQLTRQSGLLASLEKGDSVMADKGFDISDLLLPLDV